MEQDKSVQEDASDKELNFSRLREKTKRLELEAQESRKRAEELQALRDKDRRELEELRERQKELALEASLFAEDDESPDEIVVSGKLKEKQKKQAERQAHVLRKELSETRKEFEARLQEQERRSKEELSKALAEKELTLLYKTYGEEAIAAELDGNGHLQMAVSLLPTIAEKAAYLGEHFEGKEKARRLLEQSNRGNTEPINTGIGSGMVGRGDMIPSKQISLSAKDLSNAEAMTAFNDQVMASLGIKGRTKA
jgi:hypothetical protein